MIGITPYVDTAQIGPLQAILRKLAAKNIHIGGFVQFSVVVDANAVIPDLIWHIRHPERRATAFEELIKATILIAHAPKWLEIEMASAIPQVAAKRKIAEPKLWECWREYRNLLVWHDTPQLPKDAAGECCDPKDMPYVWLDSKIRADGTLTKDPHIERLGGHPLTFDFMLSTRDYARAAVVSITLRVGGIVFPAVTLMALTAILRGIGKYVAALPPAVKVAFGAGALTALCHPTSRRWLAQRCMDIGAVLSPTWQTLVDVIGALAAVDNYAQQRADASLQTASRMVRSKQLPRPYRLKHRRRLKRQLPGHITPASLRAPRIVAQRS